MAKAQLKTQETNASVEKFLNSISDTNQREDAKQIGKIIREISHEEPKMWGTAIVGYGTEHLKYASGRELDWLKVGFSPRKTNLTLYILVGGAEKYTELLSKLGKYKTGKGCLYINRLTDINIDILKEIIKTALNYSHADYKQGS